MVRPDDCLRYGICAKRECQIRYQILTPNLGHQGFVSAYINQVNGNIYSVSAYIKPSKVRFLLQILLMQKARIIGFHKSVATIVMKDFCPAETQIRCAG